MSCCAAIECPRPIWTTEVIPASTVSAILRDYIGNEHYIEASGNEHTISQYHSIVFAVPKI